MKTIRIAVASLCTAAAAGCAGIPASIAPEVPPSLRVQPGQTLFLEGIVSGTQNYECAAKPGEPAAFGWVLRDVDSRLVDSAGRVVARHYYPGPTWESVDGSKLVTVVKARVPSPDPSAVPWLLLGVKSATGEGPFSRTTSIQRVRTTGGMPSPQGCSSTSAGQVLKVDFTATCYFYRAAA